MFKLTCLWLTLSLSTCFHISIAFAESAHTGTQRIKIGVSASLSGDGIAYGTDVKNGALFANEKFGRGRLELIIEDDRCNGKGAVSSAHRLVNISQVKYVIGYACSGALLAAAPIYERSQVVVMGTATSAAAITHAGKYIFRTWPSDLESSKVLHPLILPRHKRLGILSEETDFSQGILNALIEENKGHPLVIKNENFLPMTSDFRPLLLKLSAAKVDGILLNPQSEAALILLYRQILEMGLKLPIYANYNGGSPDFLATFREKADGLIFFDAPFVKQLANPNGAQLMTEFIEKYGEAKSSPLYVLTTIAGFAALSEAIFSGEDVVNYLYNHSFSSVIDNLSFDQNGDPKGISLVLKIIKGGKVNPL